MTPPSEPNDPDSAHTHKNNSKNTRDEDSSSHDNKSWFPSRWFENDNSHMKDQIHQTLNQFEEQRNRLERQQEEFQKKLRERGGGLFGSRKPEEKDEFASVVQDMEQLFNTMASGGFGPDFSSDNWSTSTRTSTTSPSTSSRTFISSSSMKFRQDSKDGAQLEVTLPKGTNLDEVTVHVIQEYPCVVQWRGSVAPNNNDRNGSSRWGIFGRSGGSQQNEREESHPQHFQDQIVFGEGIDCSKLAASLSASRKVLSVQAPVYSPPTSDATAPIARNISVTDHDP